MKSYLSNKYTEEIICKKRLKRKYCEAQIDDMISEKLDQEAENGRQNIMMMHSNCCAMQYWKKRIQVCSPESHFSTWPHYSSNQV